MDSVKHAAVCDQAVLRRLPFVGHLIVLSGRRGDLFEVIWSDDRMNRVMRARAAATGLSMAQVEADEVAAISMGRMIDPDEIADMVVFICSNSGRSISGQSLGVRGNTENPEIATRNDPMTAGRR